MESAATRKVHVQTLRRLAKGSGVSVPRDDARREKVEELGEALARSSLSEEKKQKAAETLQKYLRTFPAPASVGPVAVGFRLRGRSFLLTFNCDFFNKAFPDGTPRASCPADLWRLWRDWKAAKKKELGVSQSTSTLERSLDSPLEDRVHFHWKLNLLQPIDWDSPRNFAFHGVCPDARPTVVAAPTKQARGGNFAEASNRGHFYCWAPKRGSLYKGTNWHPFKKYRVQGRWLDELWTDGKLDDDAYETLALRVKLGFGNRRRDLEQVRAAAKETQVDAEMSAVAEELEKLKAPPRVFQEVRDWEDSFLELKFRWKLLLLVADSASGKSTFAEGLFSNPYVLTVEDAEDLDLRGFDRHSHDGIVLDNVNSWQQLLNWRAVLQARNAKSRGGQSKTNVYAYVQYLFGVPVVATVDLDAPDAHLVDKDSNWRSKWLLKNGVFVRLEAGETFFKREELPTVKLENKFSLFAQTVKRRRLEEPQVG